MKNLTRRSAIQLLALMGGVTTASAQDKLLSVGSEKFVIYLDQFKLVEVKHGSESTFISSQELFDALRVQNDVDSPTRLVDGHCPVCGFKGSRLVATASTDTEHVYACENCGNVFWAPVA